MSDKELYKCGDCGFIGASKSKFYGAWYLLVPLWIVLIILALGAPYIGIPIIIGMFLLGRRNHCSSCGSKNVIRHFTDEELRVRAQQESEAARQQAEATERRNETKKREMSEARERQLMRRELDDVSDGSRNINIKIIGGAGWEDMHGSDAHLKISTDSICFVDLKNIRKVLLPNARVCSMDISGPGTVASGPNISGGGFGVQGAITGMAIATAANILLTHRSTKTIVRVASDDAEVIFLSSEMEPDSMRVLLSPVYVALGRKDASAANALDSQLTQLKRLLDSGALSDEQYRRAVDKLLE